MICNLIRFACVLPTVFFCVSKCDAAVMFDLRSTALPLNSIVGNILTLTKTDSSGGVSFSATLTVTGNKPFVSSSPTGMGTGNAGDNNVNSGTVPDVLTFTMSVTALSPGSVAFDGFEWVYINALAGSEKATLNRDSRAGETINAPVSGPFGLQYSPLLSFPTTVSLSGQVGSYQVSQIDALFSGTPAAVPEPSAVPAFFGLMAALLFTWRFRGRINSVNSDSIVA